MSDPDTSLPIPPTVAHTTRGAPPPPADSSHTSTNPDAATTQHITAAVPSSTIASRPTSAYMDGAAVIKPGSLADKKAALFGPKQSASANAASANISGDDDDDAHQESIYDSNFTKLRPRGLEGVRKQPLWPELETSDAAKPQHPTGDVVSVVAEDEYSYNNTLPLVHTSHITDEPAVIVEEDIYSYNNTQPVIAADPYNIMAQSGNQEVEETYDAFVVKAPAYDAFTIKGGQHNSSHAAATSQQDQVYEAPTYDAFDVKASKHNIASLHQAPPVPTSARPSRPISSLTSPPPVPTSARPTFKAPELVQQETYDAIDDQQPIYADADDSLTKPVRGITSPPPASRVTSTASTTSSTTTSSRASMPLPPVPADGNTSPLSLRSALPPPVPSSARPGSQLVRVM